MARWIQFACLALLSTVVVSCVDAQDLSPAELQYFKKVGTITFDQPETLLIASIEHLDVDASGRLLVTDPMGEQVFLFDSTGTLLATLDPRICHPGFEFSPISAMFGGNDFIFLANSSPWGYRFTSDGDCLGSVDPSFDLPSFMDIDPTGILYGIEEGPFWEVRRMSATGKQLESFSVPQPKFPNASSRFADGGIVADGSHIFYAWGPEPVVVKYSLGGTLLERIQDRDSYFQSARRDLPAELSPELFAALRNWNGTITRTIFELTDQMIMVQYLNGERGTGYQVFTKNGELVAEELGIGGRFFIHGGFGLAYGLVQPELDDNGELPNPYLNVYRFVAR